MKRCAALLPLLVLLLVPAGCGSKDALELDPVAEAATKTAEHGSSRVEFTMDMTVAGGSIAMTGTGIFDYRNSRGSVTYRMAIPQLGDVTMDMRMVGTKMYMRMPKELTGGAGLPSGKQWLGFDLGKSLEQAGLGGLDFTQQQDPAQTLRLLRAASRGVTEAGAAEVRGVDTTRYVGVMDFRKALEAGLDQLGMSAAERKKARDAMKSMVDQLASGSLPFEVFVDKDGLVRRLKMDLTMKAEGEQVTMAMQMDYFDFGVAVDVEAPPASSVFDVTDQLQP